MKWRVGGNDFQKRYAMRQQDQQNGNAANPVEGIDVRFERRSDDNARLRRRNSGL